MPITGGCGPSRCADRGRCGTPHGSDHWLSDFFVAAPGVVAGLVPWWITHWRLRPVSSVVAMMRPDGGVLMGAGVLVLIGCFRRFALEGLGTPAPVFPTRHLVVTGFYRFVRNPMYAAAASIVAGQAMLLSSVALLGWALCVGIAFHLFVIWFEEPSLRRRFGSEYGEYCAAVRRWLPTPVDYAQRTKE